MSFADHAAAMDAEVDERLGDSLSYKRPADPAYVAKKGFITFEEPPEGWGPLDSAKGRTYLKISKAQLPTEPSKADRITSPKLTGTWRPLNVQPSVGGRAWLAEIQKV